MKKLTIVLLALVAFTIKTNAQIPNGGFENWSGGDPVSWDTPNGDLMGMITVVNEVTTSPYAGSKSVLLETKNLTIGFPLFINQDVPGIITLGEFTANLSAGTGDLTGGIPWTTRSRVIKFAYKAETAGVDTFMIAAMLFKGGDTVAYQLLRRHETVTSWTQDSIVFIYEDSTGEVNLVNDYPDSLNIICMSSDTALVNITAGSKLWLDAMTIEGSVPLLSVSTKDIPIEKSVSIYPNPASNILTLDFSFRDDAIITFYNSLGQTVYKTKNKTIKQDIDVSSYPRGIYFVEITTDTKKITKKIVIK